MCWRHHTTPTHPTLPRQSRRTSLVRFKLFTLDHRLVRGELGHLAQSDRALVRAALARLLGM
jgi:hypothetical protein